MKKAFLFPNFFQKVIFQENPTPPRTPPPEKKMSKNPTFIETHNLIVDGKDTGAVWGTVNYEDEKDFPLLGLKFGSEIHFLEAFRFLKGQFKTVMHITLFSNGAHKNVVSGVGDVFNNDEVIPYLIKTVLLIDSFQNWSLKEVGDEKVRG